MMFHQSPHLFTLKSAGGSLIATQIFISTLTIHSETSADFRVDAISLTETESTADAFHMSQFNSDAD